VAQVVVCLASTKLSSNTVPQKKKRLKGQRKAGSVQIFPHWVNTWQWGQKHSIKYHPIYWTLLGFCIARQWCRSWGKCGQAGKAPKVQELPVLWRKQWTSTLVVEI
jgi:hypothetical protein